LAIRLFIELAAQKKRKLEEHRRLSLDTMLLRGRTRSILLSVLVVLAFLLLKKCSHFFFGKAICWTFVHGLWFLSCSIKGCFGDQALGEAKGEAKRRVINNPGVKLIASVRFP
jgi:hypothetical protein